MWNPLVGFEKETEWEFCQNKQLKTVYHKQRNGFQWNTWNSLWYFQRQKEQKDFLRWSFTVEWKSLFHPQMHFRSIVSVFWKAIYNWGKTYQFRPTIVVLYALKYTKDDQLDFSSVYRARWLSYYLSIWHLLSDLLMPFRNLQMITFSIDHRCTLKTKLFAVSFVSIEKLNNFCLLIGLPMHFCISFGCFI